MVGLTACQGAVTRTTPMCSAAVAVVHKWWAAFVVGCRAGREAAVGLGLPRPGLLPNVGMTARGSGVP